MIPGFEDGLVGIKKGEEKTIKVTFPADYFAKDVAGKVAEFTVHAHKISEPELPKMDVHFIKKLGIKSGNVDELRAEIKKNLDREVERLITTKLKTKVFDLLINQNPLEVPRSLIEKEAQRIHDEMHPHHGKEHHHTEDEMSEFNEAAKRNVILGLLIGEYINQHKMKPDATRVQDHLTKMAAAYEKPSEVIHWYTSDKKRLAEIEMFILEEMLVEKLLENVTVTEIILAYDDLIKAH
jgi:trigger factor